MTVGFRSESVKSSTDTDDEEEEEQPPTPDQLEQPKPPNTSIKSNEKEKLLKGLLKETVPQIQNIIEETISLTKVEYYWDLFLKVLLTAGSIIYKLILFDKTPVPLLMQTSYSKKSYKLLNCFLGIVILVQVATAIGFGFSISSLSKLITLGSYQDIVIKLSLIGLISIHFMIKFIDVFDPKINSLVYYDIISAKQFTVKNNIRDTNSEIKMATTWDKHMNIICSSTTVIFSLILFGKTPFPLLRYLIYSRNIKTKGFWIGYCIILIIIQWTTAIGLSICVSAKLQLCTLGTYNDLTVTTSLIGVFGIRFMMKAIDELDSRIEPLIDEDVNSLSDLSVSSTIQNVTSETTSLLIKNDICQKLQIQTV